MKQKYLDVFDMSTFFIIEIVIKSTYGIELDNNKILIYEYNVMKKRWKTNSQLNTYYQKQIELFLSMLVML